MKMKYIKINTVTPKRIVFAYFGFILVLGFLVFSDYGVSCDEPLSRLNGMVSTKYIANLLHLKWNSEEFSSVPELNAYVDRDYGVAFEMPAYIIEKIFPLHDMRAVYDFRHGVTFLVFYCGLMALYGLVVHRFKDWKLGIFAVSMLILSPRFFADAFYNSKDIVFMAFYCIATYSMCRFLVNPTGKLACFHALCSGLAVDTRLVSIIIPFGTVGLLVAKAIAKEVPYKKTFFSILTYCSLTWVVILIFWPWLWESPLKNFITALVNMSHFRADGFELYFGVMQSVKTLPWHYLPVWIGITTPVPYIILFFIGLYAITRNIITCPIDLILSEEIIIDVATVAMIFFPLIAIVAMHSILYNGWRHVYFVYPFFVIIATAGVFYLYNGVLKSFLSKKIIITSILVVLFFNILTLISYHPAQQVYFNLLAGSNLRKEFPLDYWGTGGKQVLEYICKNDNSKNKSIGVTSKVPTGNFSFSVNEQCRSQLMVRTDQVLSREDLVNPPDYLITNYYKSSIQNQLSEEEIKKMYDVFYRYIVGSEIIYTVYKRK